MIKIGDKVKLQYVYDDMFEGFQYSQDESDCIFHGFFQRSVWTNNGTIHFIAALIEVDGEFREYSPKAIQSITDDNLTPEHK